MIADLTNCYFSLYFCLFLFFSYLLILHPLQTCFHLSPAGDRRNFASSDVSDILSEEIEEDVKAAAEISMGTEVSEEDINNIIHLCDQVCTHIWIEVEVELEQ